MVAFVERLRRKYLENGVDRVKVQASYAIVLQIDL